MHSSNPSRKMSEPSIQWAPIRFSNPVGRSKTQAEYPKVKSWSQSHDIIVCVVAEKCIGTRLSCSDTNA